MDEYLKAACTAAGKAAEYLYRKQDAGKTRYKRGRELVTEADLEAQEIIFDELERFGLPFQSEEKNASLSKGTRWVIDPIDGTEHYVRNAPFYSVSIALVKDGVPVVGAVNVPALDIEYCAEKGDGAFKNGKRIAVSRVVSLDYASVFIHPYRRFKMAGYEGAFLQLSKKIRHPRYFASSEFELAFMAEGAADAVAKPAFRLWDVAAGAVIVTEAGGKITDFDGRPWNANSNALLASNGRVHGALLKLIQKERGKKIKS
jgi:myo-inositol-1(or 4)-monophosphatase